MSQEGPNSRVTAVNKPVIPPISTTALSHDLPSPIASSIPWMGKGEKTSQRLNPASRTRLAASELYEAAKRVRDAGFKRWDVFSPFPIHGMDEAMGLGKSWLSAVVLIGGITGLLTAVILEFGPSWFIYPVIVHGKPFNWATVPAFFPIMFELTVLFSAFAAFFANLIMNGLPRWHHPMFNWDRFSRVTNDGFFLAIEARDPRFSEMETHDLLLETGGLHITIVHEED